MDIAEDALADANEATDPAYRWAVRALYLGILAANLYVFYDMVKDTPDVMIARARLAAWWKRLQQCEGCEQRKAALKSFGNKMHGIAREIVDADMFEGQAIDAEWQPGPGASAP